MVSLTTRVHPFPFRTRKLSSSVAKILVWRRTGKIARCQHQTAAAKPQLLSFLYPSPDKYFPKGSKRSGSFDWKRRSNAAIRSSRGFYGNRGNGASAVCSDAATNREDSTMPTSGSSCETAAAVIFIPFARQVFSKRLQTKRQLRLEKEEQRSDTEFSRLLRKPRERSERSLLRRGDGPGR